MNRQGVDAVATVDAGPMMDSPAVVRPASRLRGTIDVPGDKSISHRALMFALLADGTSRIVGAGDGADVRSTARMCGALGASVDREARDDGNVTYRVEGRGGSGLVENPGTLDCGNSGTSLRLFAGILAGNSTTAILDGDASLRRRPMNRIVDPLRAMGAGIEALGDQGRPPLAIEGRAGLEPIDWATPVPSAQVKSAILLAGLRASGTTRVRESVATRDHTERMLRARGVAVRTSQAGDGSVAIEIDGGTAVRAMDEVVPGDPSAAAFWLVAGTIHPDADLALEGIGTNPTRRGIIDLLLRMGARIDERPLADVATGSGQPAVGDPRLGDQGVGEPRADLRVRSASLRAIDVSPAEVAGAIDEIPILCLAATQAAGTTTIRGAAELRNKESDRLAGIADGLTALGAKIRVDGDDIVIDGPARLRGAATDSLDDHRLAMTFAIAGLIAAGTTTVGRPASASISYPGFFADLERIRA